MRLLLFHGGLREHAFVWSDSSTGLVDLKQGEAGESVERGKRKKGFGPLWGSVWVVAEM